MEQILLWADAHHQRTGKWPTLNSGVVPESSDDNWRSINNALYLGLRDLPGGSSLAQVFAEQRNARNNLSRPQLTEDQILLWADQYNAATGGWPKEDSGVVRESPDDNWRAISAALQLGHRGLPGGLSLAQFLAEKRNVRNRMSLPTLNEEQILAWADADRERTGKWPTSTSGIVHDAPGETWTAIDLALRNGNRGFPGGSSLARLLNDKRRQI